MLLNIGLNILRYYYGCLLYFYKLFFYFIKEVKIVYVILENNVRYNYTLSYYLGIPVKCKCFYIVNYTFDKTEHVFINSESSTDDIIINSSDFNKLDTDKDTDKDTDNVFDKPRKHCVFFYNNDQMIDIDMTIIDKFYYKINEIKSPVINLHDIILLLGYECTKIKMKQKLLGKFDICDPKETKINDIYG